MRVEFKDGLIYTSIKVSFKGTSKNIDNIVIDTGAAESIISTDTVEDIGIIAESNDVINSFYGVGGSLHHFFSKKIDDLILGNFNFGEIKMDFGVIDPIGRINGLLGLDLLMKMGAIIDLKEMSLKVQ